MSDVNVVDSSGWLEYFTDSDRAPLFAPAIEDTENLLVPVISIYEVFKKVLRERGDKQATAEQAVLQKLQPHLDAGKPGITLELSPEEKAVSHLFWLLTDKPALFGLMP